MLYTLDITDSDGNTVDAQLINTVDISVYTTGNARLEYSKESLLSNRLNIPSEDLATLDNGQIHVQIHYSFEDSSFPDGKEDIIQTYHLNKYLQHAQ